MTTPRRERGTPIVVRSCDRFAYAIGPFRTKAGAEIMRDNPYCETVAQAERITWSTEYQ